MKLKLFGIEIHLIAVAIFIFATLFVTEVLKRKLLKNYQGNFLKLLLSWVVGAVIFVVIGLFKKDLISIEGIVQFAFFTALLNGGYRLLKRIKERVEKLKHK